MYHRVPPGGSNRMAHVFFSNYLLWLYSIKRGTSWRIWLRHCATSRKVAVLFPILSLKFLLLFPAALWTLGSTQTPIRMSSRNISCGWEGGWCVGFTSPTSCANCLEIWEPLPLGTLRAWNRSYKEWFTFFFLLFSNNVSSPLCLKFQQYGVVTFSSKCLCYFT